MRSPGATTGRVLNVSDYLPKFSGASATFTASAAITGGRLVAVAGTRLVAQASADSATVIGVAAFDGVTGDPVTVYTRPTGVHSLTASGAIATGAKVAAAATGKVQTVAALLNPIGIALEAATADLDVVDVMFI